MMECFQVFFQRENANSRETSACFARLLKFKPRLFPSQVLFYILQGGPGRGWVALTGAKGEADI